MEATLDEFIEAHGIEAEAEYADDNPNADWEQPAQHWAVLLKCEGRETSIPFSQGMAHTEPPTAADVLDCVASDYASLENAGGDPIDLTIELGGTIESSEDVAKARKLGAVIEENSEKVRALVGAEAFESLVWDTERL